MSGYAFSIENRQHFVSAAIYVSQTSQTSQSHVESPWTSFKKKRYIHCKNGV